MPLKRSDDRSGASSPSHPTSDDAAIADRLVPKTNEGNVGWGIEEGRTLNNYFRCVRIECQKKKTHDFDIVRVRPKCCNRLSDSSLDINNSIRVSWHILMFV